MRRFLTSFVACVGDAEILLVPRPHVIDYSLLLLQKNYVFASTHVHLHVAAVVLQPWVDRVGGGGGADPRRDDCPNSRHLFEARYMKY